MWINQGDIVLLSLRDFQDDKADVIVKYTSDEARNRMLINDFTSYHDPDCSRAFWQWQSKRMVNSQKMPKLTRQTCLARKMGNARLSLGMKARWTLMISRDCPSRSSHATNLCRKYLVAEHSAT